MKKIVAIALAIILTLAACTAKDEPFDPNRPLKLTVLYGGNPRSFDYEYGSYLASKFPNLEFELISEGDLYKIELQEQYEKEYIRLVQAKQPDLIIAGDTPLLMKYNLIDRLDPYIRQDGFDLNGMYPGMIDLLKARGDGSLCGLTPQFRNHALFYNIDLFEKYGIEPPRNGMTWDEVLTLAQRFPANDGGEPVYGFARGNYYSKDKIWIMLELISETERLQMVSADVKQLLMDTASWTNLYDKVMRAVQSGAVKPDGSSGLKWETHDFIMGRAAMSFHSYGMLVDFHLVQQDLKDWKPFRWGVVTAPIDPLHPDETTHARPAEMFSIYAHSPHKRAAWEVIKYIHGEEYAKLRTRIVNTDALMMRTAFNIDKDGHDLSPFYALKPVSVKGWMRDDLDFQLYTELRDLVTKESDKALNGEQSVEEALSRIQTEGQHLVDEMNLKRREVEEEYRKKQEQAEKEQQEQRK
ncbi:ABC transporter substrate-binding protein [Paenibacillus sp. MSJ-34]|uniref:ABC transporter substrate-binding protein n=1 Tax=Paenibacillus sp. MSJ-34 TaxID=2841529 RepID=UPI001C126839|nr:extracellular solute-binding protein [Paenibacillus sp. MSJ-34]MBU5441981.1 extracellular solute-binding protein [Paenibacillus sp. MSJ-34]